MVWVKCHNKMHNLKLHHTERGKKYVMVRRKGKHGGTRRKYL